MYLPTRQLSYFFFGQNFSDGLRTTAAIVLPALVGAQLGHFDTGMLVSTGAACVSVTDTPGPPRHRRNGLLAALGLVFGTALLTGVAAQATWALALEVTVLGFAYTMLLVWGQRAANVGSAALLSMVLLLAHPPALAQLLPRAGLLLGGGIWYAGLAFALHRVLPYRPAQQALGECLHAVAGFLQLKASFYNPRTDLDDDYRRLVAQQVAVSEKQEAVRDLLFRTRQAVNESTVASRRLLLTFVETVDLYDRITASHYDYAVLRRDFGPTGVLAEVEGFIRRIAAEVDNLGAAILANRPRTSPAPAFAAELTSLQARLTALEAAPPPGTNPRTLRRVLVNLRDLARRVAALRRYFDESQLPATPGRPATDYTLFVARQELQWRAFGENLTLGSSVFRHAVRMMLACLTAFLVAELLWHGSHSYWILMTTTFMLKPGFSLTKQRNKERIAGTLLGGALGAAILWLLPVPEVRFGFLVVFMVVAYTFQRTVYFVTVVFLTAYLLILFSFLGLGYLGVAEERITDTAIGCAIAFAAGYFLFPSWEHEQLRDLLAATLRANLAYLRQLADRLAGGPPPATSYRLLRKDVYVASANLAAAFQRMLSEPKSKQRHPAEIHQFVVLNHILSAGIASVGASLPDDAPPVPAAGPGRRALVSAQAALAKSLACLTPGPATAPLEPRPAAPETAPAPADPLLLEQLSFLQKVSGDIGKVTEVLAKNQ